jgi:hypothetical protein
MTYKARNRISQIRSFSTCTSAPQNNLFNCVKLHLNSYKHPYQIENRNLTSQFIMLRSSITRQVRPATRLFATTARYQKGPVELGKDALKKVDRVVSDAAVKGIETGGMYWPVSHSMSSLIYPSS